MSNVRGLILKNASRKLHPEYELTVIRNIFIGIEIQGLDDIILSA